MKPIFFVALLCLSLAACTSADESMPNKATNGRGVVVAKLSNGAALEVLHEDMGEGMPAMRMQVRVANMDDVREIEAGDVISFRLLETGEGFLLDEIRELPADTEIDVEGVMSKQEMIDSMTPNDSLTASPSQRP
ncbi:MAG: copper-binding protein [Bacteroidota bacterium]